MDSNDLKVTIADIARLRNTLRSRPRDLLFFELAIQSGLYAKVLLQLKVSDLEDFKTGQELRLNNKGIASLRMTSSIRRAFMEHVRKANLSNDDYLFPSRKGRSPLTLISLSRLVSSWFKAVGLPELHGFLTLRRIWFDHVTAEECNMGESPRSPKRLQKQLSLVSLRESIFVELQREIISGKIIPGQRVFIENIARRMGVSIIPAREAFAMLAACGFLRSDGRRGYLANELSIANLREILELRLMLESKAAEKAALHRTEEGLSWIVQCHTNFVEARSKKDVEGIFRANWNFHDAIYSQANMPILKSHIDQAWYRVSPYYHIIFRQVERPLPITGVHNHEKIIEGLRRKNAKETCKWVKEDLRANARFVIEVLRIQQIAGEIAPLPPTE